MHACNCTKRSWREPSRNLVNSERNSERWAEVRRPRQNSWWKLADLTADHYFQYGTCLLFFTPTLPIKSDNSDDTSFSETESLPHFGSIAVFIALV